MQLDERTTVRTENLIYNHQAGIVTAPDRATIDQQGTQGHANSFEYDMNTGLLKMNGDVDIVTENHLEIQAGSALFQQKQNWTTMSGGVVVKSSNGWVRGSSGRADLEPGTYKPKTITIDGGVTAESRPETGHQEWKVRSDWMEATMSEAGTPDQVRTRGNVEIEKIAGDLRQHISGNEIDTKFKDGKVDTLEARQNARMILGSDQTLESSQIWTNATGSVKTADSSVLKVGDSTIQGKEFVIENGETIVSFSTVRPATLKKADGQESSSDRTRAKFDNRTNMLLELVQTGNFQFRTAQYQGSAQTGSFEQGGTVVILEGSPVVNDSEKRLEASQIRVNQSDNSFVATKNVSTLMKNPNDQVLVKAARAEGSGDSILYIGGVQLWREDAYIKSDRLSANRAPNGQTGKMHAEGANGGKVQSILKNIRATSDILDYDDSSGVVHYLGHVRAQKQDMILEAPDMTVNFRDKNVTEIVASGGVIVTRADQRGTGDQAVYDAATDVVTLTGKPAEVRDKERGLSQGAKLTLRDKGQTATVESGNGQRTVTKHPIKNDKK